MIRDDRVLLVQLARVNSQVSGFALAFTDGKISPDEQIEFAHQFVDLADALLRHANERKRVVIDRDVEAGRAVQPYQRDQ